jgi:hypothetical protein
MLALPIFGKQEIFFQKFTKKTLRIVYLINLIVVLGRNHWIGLLFFNFKGVNFLQFFSKNFSFEMQLSTLNAATLATRIT